MKSILIPILGVIAFIVFVGILTRKLSVNPISFSNTYAAKQIKIGDKSVTVDVADTEEKRVKGLSGKTTLAEGSGMLFVFDNKKTFPTFWMKDMIIPIDIIWIADDKVAKIDKNVSVPTLGTPDNKLTLYHPDKPVDYVLEVNSGFSDKNNIKAGDSVDLSNI